MKTSCAIGVRPRVGVTKAACGCRGSSKGVASPLVPLEEAVYVLGQLRTDSFRGGDLLHGRFPQPVYRTELSQQQILPVLADSRAIVEDAFADPLLHQELVI